MLVEQPIFTALAIFFFSNYASTNKYRCRRLIHTHLYENIYANPTPHEHFKNIVPAHLEINKVTIDVSLPSTESIMTLNSRINPKKCEH
jgi:hypothetical protein